MPSTSFSFGNNKEEEELVCECLKTRAERHRLIGKKWILGDWDCSKFIKQLWDDCGIALLRCTSADYAEGKCGFNTVIVKLNERDECDFSFFTFPSKKGKTRKFGHTGMQKNKEQIYHNSTGRKRVVLDWITWGTYMRKYLKRTRRLNPNRGK
ncbi:MAG: hypothetical protein ACFFCZ_20205 [Promethearchaeota archaeon]